VEVVRSEGPNDFAITARVVVGSGDDAMHDPDVQEDPVLVDLTKDPGSTVAQPCLGECVEAHRQREVALGMQAEDIDIAGAGTAAATPAPMIKRGKRKNTSKQQ
jgi:hypothetical protein